MKKFELKHLGKISKDLLVALELSGVELGLCKYMQVLYFLSTLTLRQ